MTDPYREELAGRLPGDLSERLEAIASALSGSGLWDQSVATLREAAAALRQSPRVEEVHDAILTRLYGPCDQISDKQDAAIFDAAREIDRLYRGSKE